LRSCLKGVENAIASEDYEKATEYVSNVLNLDKNVNLNSKTTLILLQAETKIKEKIKENFEKSLMEENQAGMQRFGKLFQPLNIDNEGVLMYTNHVLKEIKSEVEQIIEENIDTEGISHDELLYTILDLIASVIENEEEFVIKNFERTKNIFYEKTMEILDENGIKILEKFEEIIKKIEKKNINFKRTIDYYLDELVCLTTKYIQFYNFVSQKMDGSKIKIKLKLNEMIKKYYFPSEEAFLNETVKYIISISNRNDNFYDVEDMETLNSITKELTIEEENYSAFIDDFFFVFNKIIDRCFQLSCIDVHLIFRVMNIVENALSNEIKNELNTKLTKIDFNSSLEHKLFLVINSLT
jgi:conserved oligomeric Golgi complex subunit 4